MKYVALLRGIMPMNPNMRGEKLRGAFEDLGFKHVETVIASGNVLFESNSKNEKALETKIENGLENILGFKRAAIVRSQAELKKLAKKNPFKGIKDERPNYLVVTFFKHKNAAGREMCTVINLDGAKTPDFMRNLEKEHGKDVTTRTWKTVLRILEKMEK